jgi:rubrerythrin
MTDLLQPAEIIDFAISIEEMGYRFYVESLKNIDHAEVLSFFQIMADEEFQHKNTFQRIKEDIGDYHPQESYEGEYRQYMTEFLKAHSLADRNQLENKIAAVKTPADAIKTALDFERDSIIFFSHLKRMVKSHHRELIEEIIQEEVTHIFKINRTAKTLGINL